MNPSFCKRPLSWGFRLVLALFALVLANVIAVSRSSVESEWRDYQPWLGEPEELIKHVEYIDSGGSDVFHLRLSEQQDWVLTLRLEGSTKDPAQAGCYLIIDQNIKLEQSGTPERMYTISLRRLTDRENGDHLKDIYELSLFRVFPSEGSTKEMITLLKRYPEQERSTVENIVNWGSLVLFFFLPALVGRLFVRRREGLFPSKELLFSFIGACIFFIPFLITSFLSTEAWTSSSSNRGLLLFYGSFVLGPVICGPTSLILYLIIGLYRRWRRSRELAALPTPPDAGAL